MNEPTPTLRAFASVVQPILTTASAVVGLGALAYIIGWRETHAYFATLGAPWISGLLGPTRLMQASAWVVTINIMLLLVSVYSIGENGATHRVFRWLAIALLGFGIVLWQIDLWQIDYVSPTTRAMLLGLGAVCFALSSAITVAEVVARYGAYGFRWRPYYLLLFFYVILLTFSWAPSRMGEAKAKLVMHSEAVSLPPVELSIPDSTTVWRLLEVTESSAVLVEMGKAPAQNRFRVVPLSELRSVASASRTN